MAGKTGPRQLLVASVGVATINYVLAGLGAGCSSETSPEPTAGSSNAGTAGAASGGKPSTGGNGGSAISAGGPPTVANLPAPPPILVGGSSGKAP